MFESGLSNALVFFAPRRMGKTEFLRKDIQPLAEKKGWQVFYLSFLDTGDRVQREFTSALAEVKVTKRKLDGDLLWSNFLDMDKVPQLARSLVERLALNPSLTLVDAKEQLLSDVFNDRALIEIWENASKLEQLLLKEIAKGVEAVFSQKQRTVFARSLGVPELTVSSVQSSIRVLQRKNLIGKLPEGSNYYIDDPNFKSWLQLYVS